MKIWVCFRTTKILTENKTCSEYVMQFIFVQAGHTTINYYINRDWGSDEQPDILGHPCTWLWWTCESLLSVCGSNRREEPMGSSTSEDVSISATAC